MHSLRSPFGLLALALTLCAPSAPAQPLPPAKQVIDRYIQAVGGRATLAGKQFRHTVAEMQMPATGMRMTIETFQARPNRLLVKTEMPGLGSVAYGFDGRVGWMSNPRTGPQLLEGKELQQRVQEADFDSSIEYGKYFSDIQTVGRAELGGRPCYRLRMTSLSVGQIFQCFDVQSGLLVGSEARQRTEAGELSVTTLFSDYRDFDGLKLPMKMTSSMMGQEMTVTLKSVSFAPIDATTFALPASVRALMTRQ